MLQRRSWVPADSETLVQSLAAHVASASADALGREIERLATENRAIHERDCINLNPAGNVMNPRAEALLAQGLGSRPSLGYPGAKHEMGLEAIERIEAIATALAAEIFDARFAEIRVGSGALANLTVFMATTRPGDAIIAPPASFGGHASHHQAGAAGRYGLVTHPLPVDEASLAIDLDRLRDQARRVGPKLITIGGSLNLFPYPVAEVRAIADEVGALVVYDAAHMAGPIAGGAWQQPLAEGAHVMTMSTYKSLAGPPGGLILTNDPDLAERLDRVAFPGMTANFDVAKSAALAMTLLDWRVHGRSCARAMLATARALAEQLDEAGVAVWAGRRGFTASHQFAIAAGQAGHETAKRLRRANILASAIALPAPATDGVRLGTSEIVRWGMAAEHMAPLADLIARALQEEPTAIAPEVTAFRRQFAALSFVR